jgi:hypothetical protein
MFSMLRVKINFAGAEVNRKREKEKLLTPGVEQRNSGFSRVEAMKHHKKSPQFASRDENSCLMRQGNEGNCQHLRR